jgi:hypothetical protein
MLFELNACHFLELVTLKLSSCHIGPESGVSSVRGPEKDLTLFIESDLATGPTVFIDLEHPCSHARV